MLTKKGGYAYIMVLLIAASVCLAASAMEAVIFSRDAAIQKEKELIFRGMEYKKALKSFYDAGKGKKELPYNLEDLLMDPRYPDKKHIRRLYKEPINNGEWGVLLDADGRIAGVASKSKKKPMKQKGFPEELKSFEDANSYDEWVFFYDK